MEPLFASLVGLTYLEQLILNIAHTDILNEQVSLEDMMKFVEENEESGHPSRRQNTETTVKAMKKVFDSCPRLRDIIIEHSDYQHEKIPIPESKEEGIVWFLLSDASNRELKQF